MKTEISQDEAAYRVILKRIVAVALDTKTPQAGDMPDFKWMVKRADPAIIARFCNQAFKRSARSWEDGNNSGNSETLTQKEAESVRWAMAGERVMALFGIKCDWPGLYPSFQVIGHGGICHYDSLSALKAALQPAKNWETITA